MSVIANYLSLLTNYANNSYDRTVKYVKKQSKTKLFLVVTSCTLGFAVSRWLIKNRGRPHPTIPSLYVRWTPFLGHMPFMLSIVNNYTYHHITRAILAGAKHYCNERGFDSPKDHYVAVMVVRGGMFNSVMLLDPKLIEFVFETDFTSFIKGPSTAARLNDLLGSGIFTSDPPKWKTQRLAASRMFSMRNLQNFMFETAQSQCNLFINKLNQFNKAQEIDIYDLFAKYTLDTFVTIAFGESLGIIDKIPNDHPFSLAFDGYVTDVIYRFVNPFWEICNKTGLAPYEKRIKGYLKTIDQFADKIIVNKIEKYVDSNADVPNSNRQLTDETGDTHAKHDVVSLFLKYDESLQPLKSAIDNASGDDVIKAKQELTQELRHIAMNLIIAGRDTTRLLLSWFIYELSRNPEEEAKILAEIDGFYEENDKLTYQNIQSYFGSKSSRKSYFKYLECCLLETLRLHPPVPYLVRWAQNDVLLPNTDNWIITKGTRVAVAPWVLARLPWIWGDDCNEFKPMRWWDKGINSFSTGKYPVFNLMPRLCLGRQVAIMEAKIMCIQFLKNFKFQLVEGQEITYLTSLLLNMTNGMNVRIYPREEKKNENKNTNNTIDDEIGQNGININES